MNPVKIYNDVNRFVLDWTINSLCTYHCSYCPETLHRGVNVLKNKDKNKLLYSQQIGGFIIIFFLIEKNKQKSFVEVKNVTLFRDNTKQEEDTITPHDRNYLDESNKMTITKNSIAIQAA